MAHARASRRKETWPSESLHGQVTKEEQVIACLEGYSAGRCSGCALPNKNPKVNSSAASKVWL